MSKNKQNHHTFQREKAAYKKQKEQQAILAQQEAERKHQHLLQAVQKAKEKSKLPPEMESLEEISPKFGEHLRHNRELLLAVQNILKQPSFVRPLTDWKPQGKSYESLFISLANHLFAKYKTAPFLWSAFYHHDTCLHDLVSFIGRGNSLFNFAKNEARFGIPVTRQMSHIFSQCTADFNIMEALRYSQFMSFGDNKRLYQGFKGTVPTRQLVAYEPFVASVIQWYCNQPMLDPGQVAPIWDYLNHCHTEDEKYSMKGRTADSVIRKMEEWHAHLHKRRWQKGNIIFKSSGFEGVAYDWSQDKNIQIWRVFELLSSDELWDEGRRMGHCVGSYSGAVQNGRCSIWSLTFQDNTGNWSMNTIEVDNATKRLVQVRGKHNRQPTVKEQQVLTRWANEKGLFY